MEMQYIKLSWQIDFLKVEACLTIWKEFVLLFYIAVGTIYVGLARIASWDYLRRCRSKTPKTSITRKDAGQEPYRLYWELVAAEPQSSANPIEG